jgi:hypothetical protein
MVVALFDIVNAASKIAAVAKPPLLHCVADPTQTE